MVQPGRPALPVSTHLRLSSMMEFARPWPMKPHTMPAAAVEEQGSKQFQHMSTPAAAT